MIQVLSWPLRLLPEQLQLQREQKGMKKKEEDNNKQKPVRLENRDCIGKSTDYIQRQESFRVNIFFIRDNFHQILHC